MHFRGRFVYSQDIYLWQCPVVIYSGREGIPVWVLAPFANTDLIMPLSSQLSMCTWDMLTNSRTPAGISPNFKITFYAGRYDALLLGILPVGNPMDCLARSSVDVLVLEEPEHLSWFHCGPQWTSSFKHVVSQLTTAFGYGRNCYYEQKSMKMA